MPLASNQVQYSLTYRAPERNGVLAACRELGVTLIAYSPMAQGLLTGARALQRPGNNMRGCCACFLFPASVPVVQHLAQCSHLCWIGAFASAEHIVFGLHIFVVAPCRKRYPAVDICGLGVAQRSLSCRTVSLIGDVFWAL